MTAGNGRPWPQEEDLEPQPQEPPDGPEGEDHRSEDYQAGVEYGVGLRVLGATGRWFGTGVGVVFIGLCVGIAVRGYCWASGAC